VLLDAVGWFSTGAQMGLASVVRVSEPCGTPTEGEYSWQSRNRSGSRSAELHRAARAALGEEEGDTLMALSPPANTDMATMQALERTEERLDAKIDAVAARLDAKIDAVAALLSARIDEAIAQHQAALLKQLHVRELRTMGVIVLALLGSNLIG
jgi:hypothetical protein